MPFVVLCLCLFFGCDTSDRDSAENTTLTPQEQTAASDSAAVPFEAVVGQTVYVPVYSHIYHQDGTRDFNLTATLSIRNTDPEHAIAVTGVRYFDSDGGLVRSYHEEPLRLGPLASRSFVVEERDKTGGVGANFIVEWAAGNDVSLPVIEAVMISTASNQGISFVTQGRVVRELDVVDASEFQP